MNFMVLFCIPILLRRKKIITFLTDQSKTLKFSNDMNFPFEK